MLGNITQMMLAATRANERVVNEQNPREALIPVSEAISLFRSLTTFQTGQQQPRIELNAENQGLVQGLIEQGNNYLLENQQEQPLIRRRRFGDPNARYMPPYIGPPPDIDAPSGGKIRRRKTIKRKSIKRNKTKKNKRKRNKINTKRIQRNKKNTTK
jgi:hypothetical protein